jgi:hypothetical protein
VCVYNAICKAAMDEMNELLLFVGLLLHWKLKCQYAIRNTQYAMHTEGDGVELSKILKFWVNDSEQGSGNPKYDKERTRIHETLKFSSKSQQNIPRLANCDFNWNSIQVKYEIFINKILWIMSEHGALLCLFIFFS